MIKPTGVHLIGGAPMADAETVFRAVAREPAPGSHASPMELDPVTPPFERRQWDGAVPRTGT